MVSFSGSANQSVINDTGTPKILAAGGTPNSSCATISRGCSHPIRCPARTKVSMTELRSGRSRSMTLCPNSVKVAAPVA